MVFHPHCLNVGITVSPVSANYMTGIACELMVQKSFGGYIMINPDDIGRTWVFGKEINSGFIHVLYKILPKRMILFKPAA